MLKNSIADYAPVVTQLTQTFSEEIHYHSFNLTIAVKQMMGFETQPLLNYLCHLTNRRMILETPQKSTGSEAARYLNVLKLLLHGTDAQEIAVQPFLEISHSQIQSVDVVRSMLRKPYARMFLKTVAPTPATATPHEVIFEVHSASPWEGLSQSNRAEDFVFLMQELLSAAASPTKSQHHPLMEPVFTSDVPVLVDFWAPGCRPCFVLSKNLERLMAEMQDQVQLIKINVEEHPNLADQYGINAFPTVLLFKAGIVVDQIIGVMPKSSMTKVLEPHL